MIDSPNNSLSPNIRKERLSNNEIKSVVNDRQKLGDALAPIKLFKILYMILSIIALLGLIFITASFWGLGLNNEKFKFFDIAIAFVNIWIYATIWWGLHSMKSWCPILILIIAPFNIISNILEIVVKFNAGSFNFPELIVDTLIAFFYGSQIYYFSKKNTRQYFKAEVLLDESGGGTANSNTNGLYDSYQKLFPTILRRYFSTFIDGFIVLIIVIGVSFVLSQDNEVVTKIRVGVILLMVFVYEPFCTSKLYTIGQKLTGIRVKRISDGNKISLPLAYVRIVFKIILGLISFFSIPYTEKRRAIHDIVVGSIVIYSQNIIKQVEPIDLKMY